MQNTTAQHPNRTLSSLFDCSNPSLPQAVLAKYIDSLDLDKILEDDLKPDVKGLVKCIKQLKSLYQSEDTIMQTEIDGQALYYNFHELHLNEEGMYCPTIMMAIDRDEVFISEVKSEVMIIEFVNPKTAYYKLFASRQFPESKALKSPRIEAV